MNSGPDGLVGWTGLTTCEVMVVGSPLAPVVGMSTSEVVSEGSTGMVGWTGVVGWTGLPVAVVLLKGPLVVEKLELPVPVGTMPVEMGMTMVEVVTVTLGGVTTRPGLGQVRAWKSSY